MVGLGDVSVMHVASSLVQNIGSDSATPLTGTGQVDKSSASAMTQAFGGLLQAQGSNGLPSQDSLVPSIAPFSPPPMSVESVTKFLKEAVGAFRELSGAKQNGFQQLSGMQHAGTLNDKQLSELPEIADQQHVPVLANQQHMQLSGMQHAGTLNDKQLSELPGIADQQHVPVLANQQHMQLSGMQHAGSLNDKQLSELPEIADQQHVPVLANQQHMQLSSMQHAANASEEQTKGFSQAQETSSGNEGLRMLNQCAKLFGLVQSMLAGDDDFATKSRQVIR